MLREHLSQDHDLASRRATQIDRHVQWIHERVLQGQPAAILDMACGPGLYGQRLARLGHTYLGVDFSPASIAYARQTAQQQVRKLAACAYQLSDLRQADFGPPASRDLAMLIYGELNVFRPADIRQILRKAQAALKPGGWLLIEPAAEAHIRQIGAAGVSWWSSPGGLFSDSPHLVLEENFWDEPRKVATTRYYLLDAASGEVERMASSQQGYSPEEYCALLAECGFEPPRFFPALAVEARDPAQPPNSFIALLARSSEAAA